MVDVRLKASAAAQRAALASLGLAGDGVRGQPLLHPELMISGRFQNRCC
jgi:hypothetical protein